MFSSRKITTSTNGYLDNINRVKKLVGATALQGK